jgi:molybdopterin molybdotransferase
MNTVTSVEEYQRTIAELLPSTGSERRAIADCLSAVLAEPVVAPISLPPFDNSAMDGYAVRAADIAGAPVTLPVAADIPAGRTDTPPLAPGTAHRIMTGAPMPEGADTVVQVELTDAGTETVRIDEPVGQGKHVRSAGDDVRAGMTVLTAGTVLTPSALGLAGALGLGELTVARTPRVLVVSTGSELVGAGKPLRPGQIYESNGLMLAASVRAAGAEAIQTHTVADDVPDFLAALRTDVDLIITSGGVSAGAYEVVKDALTGAGVRFLKVAMQPGGPQGFGRYQGVPVVTLPGNPVSSLVSFEVFVRPALRAAMGAANVHRDTVHATLTDPTTGAAGKRQYRRGSYADGRVRLVGGAGSHLLGALAQANCLVVIESTHDTGEDVECLLLQ